MKPFFQSKTIIVNAIIALSALIPGVESFVLEHPDLVVAAVGAVNILLRIVTKDKVVLY